MDSREEPRDVPPLIGHGHLSDLVATGANRDAERIVPGRDNFGLARAIVASKRHPSLQGPRAIHEQLDAPSRRVKHIPLRHL